MKQFGRKFIHYFFADPGEYKPAGILSPGHFLLAGMAVFGIYEGLTHTLLLPEAALRSLIR